MPDRLFDHADDLNAAFAAEIVSHLKEAMTDRGRASLVVSGGNTPAPLFSQLANTPIDWSRVTILLADERWVSSDHPDSNEGLLRRTLLRGPANQATFISLVSAFPNAEKTLEQVGTALGAVGLFDVVILGMGNDGHTASLFPCSAELQEGLATAAPVLMVNPKTAPHKRISLSAHRLKQTRWGYVHTVGTDKAETYAAAMHSGDINAAPILNFLPPHGDFCRRHASER